MITGRSNFLFVLKTFIISVLFCTSRTSVCCIIFLSLFNIPCVVFAQAPLIKEWDAFFGGSDYEYISDFKAIQDGCYLLSGYARSDSSEQVSEITKGGYDFWFVKIDSSGHKIIDRRYGGGGDEIMNKSLVTSDKGFLFGGSTDSPVSGDVSGYPRGDKDFWLVKTDSVGNKIWNARFGGAGEDCITAMLQTADNGYLIAGYTLSDSSHDVMQPPKGNTDIWLIKIYANGGLNWAKRIGGSGYESAIFLNQQSDLGYVISGQTNSGSNSDFNSLSNGGFDFYIMKLDTNGNWEWDKLYGGSQDEILTACININEGFTMFGYTYSDSSGDVSEPSKGGADYWMVSVDSIGLVFFNKRYGGDADDIFTGDIIKTIDGGYLMAGNSMSDISGDKTEDNYPANSISSWLLKIDSQGTRVWDKTLYSTESIILEYDDCRVIAFENEESNYIIGHTYHSWVVKGSAPTNSNESETDFWVRYYDVNPSSKPHVSFNTADTSLCGFPCIVFNNTTSFASSYEWHFEGGSPTISSATNPNVCYDSSGVFSVQLVATNANGSDTVFLPDYISVMGGIPPEIYKDYLSGALHASSGFSSYHWTRNGVVIQVSTDSTYQTGFVSGNYGVTVYDSNGCSFSASYTLYVNNEFLESIGINVFPNPATNQISLVLDNSFIGGIVSLRSIVGQLLYSYPINNGTTTVPTYFMEAGVYLLTISDLYKETFAVRVQIY